MKPVELQILPWAHPHNGKLAFRVSGYIRDERIADKLKIKLPANQRVRKNFKTEEQAIAWVQAAELLSGRNRPRGSVRTWIKQADVEWLEAAVNELGDAEQVYHAAMKYRKELQSLQCVESLDNLVEQYLATKRNPDGPHVSRTRNRLKQAIKAKGMASVPDLMSDGLTGWLTRPKVSGTNLRNDWIAWHGFCEWLLARNILPRNPVKLIARPRKDTPPPRSLTNDEFARLIKLAEKSKLARYLAPYYRVCAQAGLRPQSEWPHISWDSVVLDAAPEHRCIKVVRQKNEQSERYVRIFQSLETEMRKWKKKKWPLGGFDLWGNLPLERELRREHDALIEAAGIKWQADILRHTYASNAMHHFTKSELKDQMGTQESTIARYYIHPKPPELRAAFWQV